MVSQNTEFTRKLKAAVRAKIEEFGLDVDEELPDYVMIMVGNKKTKEKMKTDLKLFLGENTSEFVDWLFNFFQKIKNVSTIKPDPLNDESSVATLGESKSSIDEPTSTSNSIKLDNHITPNTSYISTSIDRKSEKSIESHASHSHDREKRSKYRDEEKQDDAKTSRKENLWEKPREHRSTIVARKSPPALRSVVVNPNKSSNDSQQHPRIRHASPTFAMPTKLSPSHPILNHEYQADQILHDRKEITGCDEDRRQPEEPKHASDERRKPIIGSDSATRIFKHAISIKPSEKLVKKPINLIEPSEPAHPRRIALDSTLFQRAINSTRHQELYKTTTSKRSLGRDEEEENSPKQHILLDSSSELHEKSYDEVEGKKIWLAKEKLEEHEYVLVVGSELGERLFATPPEKKQKQRKLDISFVHKYIGTNKMPLISAADNSKQVGYEDDQIDEAKLEEELFASMKKRSEMTFDPNMHQYDELPEESEASNKSSVVSLSEQISPKSLLIEVNQQLSWDGQINLEDESSDDEAEIDAVVEAAQKLRDPDENGETQTLPATTSQIDPSNLPSTIYHSAQPCQAVANVNSSQNSSSIQLTQSLQQMQQILQQHQTAPPTTMIIHHVTTNSMPRKIYRPSYSRYSYAYQPPTRTFTATPTVYRPRSLSKKFTHNPVSQNLANRKQNLVIVREKHRQTMQLYAIKLEEERLLLQQIQQLPSGEGSNIIEERRKMLLAQMKDVKESMQKVKAELDIMTSAIVV